jgi:hypothetical protein
MAEKELKLSLEQERAVLFALVAELRKTDAEPFASCRVVDCYLRILLGDAVFAHLPSTADEFLNLLGATASELEKMPVQEMLARLSANRPKETWIDTVRTALDMLFQQRYGWPEGRALAMSIEDLRIALEHAIEHDDPTKPSVWALTK